MTGSPLFAPDLRRALNAAGFSDDGRHTLPVTAYAAAEHPVMAYLVWVDDGWEYEFIVFADTVAAVVEALDPATTQERLAVLAGSDAVEVRSAVACRADASAVTLMSLWHENRQDRHVRWLLARNRSCPPEVLASVLDAAISDDDPDEAFDTVIQVAGNPSATELVLRRVVLADRVSGGAASVCAVALNPSCPPTLLVELAGHPDPSVRADVARNPAAPDRARALAALA